MDISIFLAKVFGIYLLVIAAAILTNKKNFKKIINNMADDLGLAFFTGIITLILGILLVVSHNIWVSDWRVIITIFAWMTFLKGVFRTLFPGKLVKWAIHHLTGLVVFDIIFLLVVGGYLTYLGFFS